LRPGDLNRWEAKTKNEEANQVSMKEIIISIQNCGGIMKGNTVRGRG